MKGRRLFVFLGSWILQISVSLIGVVLLGFCFLKFFPGSPFDEEVPLSPQIKVALENQWGFHDPATLQAYKFLHSVLEGNWGVSVTRPTQTVLGIIAFHANVTIWLNIISFLTVAGASLLLTGAVLQTKNQKVKHIFRSFVVSCSSLPTFFWAPFLIFVFGDKLGWLPPFFDGGIKSYILPVAAVFIRPWAALTLLLLDQWDEALRSRAALFAKAKGLKNIQIIYSHGLRLSILPFIQKSGQVFLQIVTGSFVIEILFGFSGLASQLVWAISNRDSTVIVGIALYYCILSLVVTQTMEVLSHYLDPRWSRQHA